jgi:heme exporter protein D
MPLLTLFTLPDGAVASSTAYIGDVMTDLGPFLWLAIGIPLAFFVIRKIISLVPKK